MTISIRFIAIAATASLLGAVVASSASHLRTSSGPFREHQNDPLAATCVTNTKQLALGTIMYTADYDDRAPIAARWKSTVYPYVKNQSVFFCPADTAKGHVSYRMNENIAGRIAKSLPSPWATVMLYEGEKWKFEARHAGSASVGFADGHVKLLPLTQAQAARRTP